MTNEVVEIVKRRKRINPQALTNPEVKAPTKALSAPKPSPTYAFAMLPVIHGNHTLFQLNFIVIDETGKVTDSYPISAADMKKNAINSLHLLAHRFYFEDRIPSKVDE